MTCQKEKKRKEKRYGPTKSLRETMISLKFEEFLNSAINRSNLKVFIKKIKPFLFFIIINSMVLRKSYLALQN